MGNDRLDGNVTVTGIVTAEQGFDGPMNRSNVIKETSIGYELPLQDFRVWDAFDQPLPSYAAASRQAIPLTFAWEPTLADSVFFVADKEYRVVAITARVEVAGTGGACTAVIRKVVSGVDIAHISAVALHSSLFDLVGTVDTNQTFTLSTAAGALDIAAGTAIGIDLSGTPTSARGTVTVFVIPASTDDLGITAGVFGVGCPHIITRDLNAITTHTAHARTKFKLPPEYVAGDLIAVRFAAGMITATAATSATLAVSCYRSARTTLVTGAELCSTSAQSINSTTFAEYSFTITPTGRSAGDVLDIRATIAAVSATASSHFAAIAEAEMMLSIRG